MGVFTGHYATPIAPDYLAHLERLRGAKKRQKTEERARHAIVNGLAQEEDLRVLAGGEEGLARLRGEANGAALRAAEEVATNGLHDGVQVAVEARDTQDISLHNLRDHA